MTNMNMNTNMNTIENLVSVIANRDLLFPAEKVEAACGDLYAALRSKLFSWLTSSCCKGDESLAEDAFQHAMIKLFVFIREDRLLKTEKIISWMQTVCRNYVLDWVHYSAPKEEQHPHWFRDEESAYEPAGPDTSRVVNFSDMEAMEEEGGYLSVIDGVADESHSYFDPVHSFFANEAKSERERVIKAAILNADHKKVFRMYAIEEKKMEEIAKELNMSLNTVKSSIYYARKALKKWQKKTGYDPMDYVYVQETRY